MFVILKIKIIKGGNYLISYFFKSSGELISYSKDLEYDSVFASINGKIINGRKILSTSDEGLKLIGASNGIFEIERVFTGTKDVVNTNSQIYSSRDGIYVVDSNEDILREIN